MTTLPLNCVVDTNVATTANRMNDGASAACVAASARALQQVMRIGHVYVDNGGEVVREYCKNLKRSGEPGPGDAFLKWLLLHEWGGQRVTRVHITAKQNDSEDFLELPDPDPGTVYDRSDRKFLAVAAANPKHPHILQSFDSKWWGWQASLAKCGVTIHFLCEDEIKAKHAEKVSMTFFRFPHTPHIAWLGRDQPRDDKVLAPAEAEALLARPVTVEEKVDGANVGLSVDEHGELRAQNRGSFLSREASHPQFKPLFRWLDERRSALEARLFPDLMLFGEWCYAVHSVAYDRLPDWFLAFDIYDRASGRFWSAPRRDALVRQLGVALVPQVATGRFDLPGLRQLLGKSQLANTDAEGLYIRADEGDHLLARAKLVRDEFTQGIEEHWSKRALRANDLAARA